jgi:hypothetical protein
MATASARHFVFTQTQVTFLNLLFFVADRHKSPVDTSSVEDRRGPRQPLLPFSRNFPALLILLPRAGNWRYTKPGRDLRHPDPSRASYHTAYTSSIRDLSTSPARLPRKQLPCQ